MEITLKPRKNKHLNAKECYLIEALLKVKFKESEIAACVKNIVLFIH